VTDVPTFGDVGRTAWSVVLAVAPLAGFFAAFQWLFLRLPAKEVSRILVGSVMASLGLFLFLLGVNIGFLPFGRLIGEAMGSLAPGWLFPLGALLGFVTTWGEPSVRILADQVEEASSGSIRRALVVPTICVGVAVAVGVGMVRIGYQIPLLWLLVPGYGLVIVAMCFTHKTFVAIAVDAGGVATGPMANTVLLALALGTASVIGGPDPLVHGLGLVALISLASVLAVMALGLLVHWKEGRKES
jgi:hypothetical protein